MASPRGLGFLAVRMPGSIWRECLGQAVSCSWPSPGYVHMGFSSAHFGLVESWVPVQTQEEGAQSPDHHHHHHWPMASFSKCSQACLRPVVLSDMLTCLLGPLRPELPLAVTCQMPELPCPTLGTPPVLPHFSGPPHARSFLSSLCSQPPSFPTSQHPLCF